MAICREKGEMRGQCVTAVRIQAMISSIVEPFSETLMLIHFGQK
jgi:hypothetical protein